MKFIKFTTLRVSVQLVFLTICCIEKNSHLEWLLYCSQVPLPPEMLVTESCLCFPTIFSTPLDAAGRGSRSWVSTTHMGSPGGISGSLFLPGPVWAVPWKFSHLCSLSLCVCVCTTLSFKEIYKSFKKERMSSLPFSLPFMRCFGVCYHCPDGVVGGYLLVTWTWPPGCSTLTYFLGWHAQRHKIQWMHMMFSKADDGGQAGGAAKASQWFSFLQAGRADGSVSECEAPGNLEICMGVGVGRNIAQGLRHPASTSSFLWIRPWETAVMAWVTGSLPPNEEVWIGSWIPDQLSPGWCGDLESEPENGCSLCVSEKQTKKKTLATLDRGENWGIAAKIQAAEMQSHMV